MFGRFHKGGQHLRSALKDIEGFVIWNWRVDFVKRRQFAQRCRGQAAGLGRTMISKLISKQRNPFSESFSGGPVCNSMTMEVLQVRSQQTFSVKGQVINDVGFTGPTVSVAATQFCC